jgi:hypothetical protein
MCQIVYDLAPHCNLAFATAFVSEVDFANNIVALRTDANCDAIVDDISYSDRPVFSDGLLAQAVNTVAFSTSLPGHPAVYCSSAGNEGDNGYISTYRDLTDKLVRGTENHGNLKLEQVEKKLTGAGTKFTATFGPTADKVTGSFQNNIGFGFDRADGFGLVDAAAAVGFIVGPATKPAR